MRQMLLVALGLALCASARADIVHLTNGRSVEGKVSETPDKVTVAMSQGSVSFPRAQVQRIERSESVLEAFERRRTALPADDAAARAALGVWALGERMDRQAKELFREALAIDPNQAEARQRLGYVLFDGKWMTPDEKMQALGLVRFESAWMTPAAVTEIKRARAEAQAAEDQRRKTEAEMAIKTAELERLRAESARAEAERRLLEAERAKVEAERRRLETLIRSYPVFRCAAGHGWYHPDCLHCRRVPVVIIRSGDASVDPKDSKGAKDSKDAKSSAPAEPESDK